MGSDLATQLEGGTSIERTDPPGVGLERLNNAAIAAAETAKARVQAQFIIAAANPRNWEAVRLRMLGAAARPGFAAIAIYERPVGGGKKATGPSIRFAEEAHRNMGNMNVAKIIIYDGPASQVWRVEAIDLETNASHACDVEVPKTVERRHLKEGQRAISTRRNANGDTVYLVPASEVDLRTKSQAACAKAKRECVLALLPGDITEETLAAVRQTMRSGIKKDPNEAKKKILDAYHSLGVSPAELDAYMGKPVQQYLEKDITELRQLYAAIRDGETTWAEALHAATSDPEKPTEAPTGDPLDNLTESMAAEPWTQQELMEYLGDNPNEDDKTVRELTGVNHHGTWTEEQRRDVQAHLGLV